MKKYFILLVSFFTFFSCQEKNNSLSQQDINKDNKLLGTWGLFAKESNEVINDSTSRTKTILCNQCPEINFSQGNKGSVITGKDGLENFNWEANHKVLLVSNIFTGNKLGPQVLGNGKYKIIYLDSVAYKVVALITSENTKYTLRKK